MPTPNSNASRDDGLAAPYAGSRLQTPTIHLTWYAGVVLWSIALRCVVLTQLRWAAITLSATPDENSRSRRPRTEVSEVTNAMIAAPRYFLVTRIVPI